MKVLFESNFSEQPLVSIILVDWSICDSFHIFDYLNSQTVPRDRYEIIWIEYYGKRQDKIEAGLRKCAELGTHPVVDKWIVMDMPRETYYHKHLLYNVGIAAGSGGVICFCDSNAIVKPAFVESIAESFNKDSDIVLHPDEPQNNNKSVNYGACMCALRRDLINIGGADEHVDYLGHICGPYEMTFRLVNYGKKEIWHQDELVSYCQLPGETRKGSYFGPHDTQNMSTTALNIPKSGRIMPLVENPAIRMLRLSKEGGICYASALSQIIPELEIEKWKIGRAKWSSKKYWIGGVVVRVKEWAVEKRQKYLLLKQVTEPVWCPWISMKGFLTRLRLFKLLFGMVIKQTYTKVTAFSKGHLEFIKTPRGIRNKIRVVYSFFYRVWEYNEYIVKVCRQCIYGLASHGIREIAVYGIGDIARIMYVLTGEMSVKITAIHDDSATKRFLRFRVLPANALVDYKGIIVIGSLVGAQDRVNRLGEIGIDDGRLVIL